MTARFSSRITGIAAGPIPRSVMAALASAFSISASVSPSSAWGSWSRVRASTSSRTSGLSASRASCRPRMPATSRSSGSGRSTTFTSFSSSGRSGKVGPTNRTVTGRALIAQTKVQRFAGSRAARLVVGQPRSTIDPAGWLRDGAIVLVNTAKGTVGEDTAALVGGTLINLVGLVVGEQAALAARDRRAVTLLVDEFHAMPGADYEAILAELAKYGANLVLATQSLARLEALDREQHRALRATVFANLDGLIAFHTSAEDARYLAAELGSAVEPEDMLELGDYQCYARISHRGERLPAFSVQLDPPPADDPAVRERLAAASAERYGRARLAVEDDLRSALARVRVARQAMADSTRPGRGETAPHDRAAVRPSSAPPGRTGARNDHRPTRGRASDLQGSFPNFAGP